MIQASGLTKRYGNLVAVNGIDLKVERGEIFGLLGPNGAGKSTTISMLVGLSWPDAGKVTLDGQNLTPDTMDLKRRIAFVPQELAIIEELSADANLRFFGGLHGLAGSELSNRIARVLEITGLQDRSTEPSKNFSGGMKRRLNLAVALLQNPDLLILDEPTVGVDPQSRNAIFEALETLNEQGMTLIYTTHYMEEVERLCDQVAIMDAGKVLANDRTENLSKLLPSAGELVVTVNEGQEAALASALGVPSGTGRVTVPVQNLAEDTRRVLAAAGKSGITITGLVSRTATLEEVFLHLTGKSLRD